MPSTIYTHFGCLLTQKVKMSLRVSVSLSLYIKLTFSSGCPVTAAGEGATVTAEYEGTTIVCLCSDINPNSTENSQKIHYNMIT